MNAPLLRVLAAGLFIFLQVVIVNMVEGAESATPVFEAYVPCRQITPATPSHWFGYYDKYQFDSANRYVLGQSIDFDDRMPSATETAELGMIDTQDHDRWIPIGRTHAWCWQQGCMLQWLPGSDTKIIYNDRRDGKFVSVIKDVKTGQERVAGRAIYSVGPDGKQALSLNFSRLYDVRPGYSYVGVDDPSIKIPHPKDDGIYLVDLEKGTSRLVVTLDQIVHFQRAPEAGEGKAWFNCLLFDPSGKRFTFLHRWVRANNRGWVSRFLTADADGGNMYVLNDHLRFSHFIWRDPTHILAFSLEPSDGGPMFFHLYEDLTQHVETIGSEVLKVDGHCSYSPDGKWILVDTYPDQERMQNLRLYRPSDKKLVPLGRFYEPPNLRGEWRCDLHPRWSRDGKSVCIDSGHSGRRQMYLLDVSGVLAAD